MEFTNKQKGLTMALIGVLFITPDSLFIRLISISSWELVFYRGLVPFICLFILLIFFYKKEIINSLFIAGLPGLFYAILISLGNTTFVISIENTNVANTLIMIALTPFATAILSSLFLKEHPSKKMWITISSCFVVVLFIFYDSYQGGRIVGDLFGLVTAILVGGSAVVVRYGKDFNFLPALLVSKCFTMFIAISLMNSFPENIFIEGTDVYLIILMGIFCVFLPMTLITIAPRYIPAYEVEIFFVLETILGPLWVWLIIHEEPSVKTIIGGILIILIISSHTFSEFRENIKLYKKIK